MGRWRGIAITLLLVALPFAKELRESPIIDNQSCTTYSLRPVATCTATYVVDASLMVDDGFGDFLAKPLLYGAMEGRMRPWNGLTVGRASPGRPTAPLLTLSR